MVQTGAVKVNKDDFDNTKCVLFVILLIIFNIYHSMWSCLYKEVAVNNTWRIISYLNSFVTQTNLINFHHLVTVISKEIQLSQLSPSQQSNTLNIHWWREYMEWHSQINTFPPLFLINCVENKQETSNYLCVL